MFVNIRIGSLQCIFIPPISYLASIQAANEQGLPGLLLELEPSLCIDLTNNKKKVISWKPRF